MNNLIDRTDTRISDIFRRLSKVEKLLAELENSTPSRPLAGLHFLSDSELSQRLRISRRTLQDYRTNGILPYYLICGKILYAESEIQKFLEKCYRKPFSME